MDKTKTFCKASLVSIALVLLLVSSAALAATENDTGNATIKDDYVSSTALASVEEHLQNVTEPSIDQSNSTQALTSTVPKVIETRITTSKTARSPAIYGDRIVWEDWRNRNNDIVNDIYMYDIGTKKETRISTSGRESMPAIHKNRIVWADTWSEMREDTWSEKSDIYMYDISTKKQTQITTSGTAYNPKVYDNIIVWQDSTSAYKYGNIWMYDLSSKKKTQITKNGSAEMPDIYENRIVWQDSRNTNEGEWYSDIYMYDLSNKKETKISTSRRASEPAINGNKVVWLDGSINDIDPNYACPAEVGVYDLSTGKETSIPLSVCEVAIYGDKIVGTWWNDGEGTSHISMYDLSNNTETLIVDGPHTVSPAIYGNRIVWADTREEEIGTADDIYMGTLVYSPVTAFSASPISGKAPLKVQFTDKSTGTPTKWKWSFGDGKYSTQKNPAYTYSKAGKYTVSLTVKNAAGTSTKTIKNYITVTGPAQKPVAAFSASPTSGKTPLNVKFTDTSTGSPTSWFWNFGDGSKSYLQNPTHKYSKAGIYTVSLKAKNAKGSNTVTKTNYITVVAKPVAAFSASPGSGKAPLKVQFTDKSAGVPAAWKWSFGDGTYSTAKNPVHKYSKAGKYTVSLKVKNAKGSNTKTMSEYIVVTKK